jgi:hypothetical protein
MNAMVRSAFLSSVAAVALDRKSRDVAPKD